MTACPTPDKNPYPGKRKAIRAALTSSRLRGVSLRVYPCPSGKHFHLTSRVRPIRKETP